MASEGVKLKANHKNKSWNMGRRLLGGYARIGFELELWRQSVGMNRYRKMGNRQRGGLCSWDLRGEFESKSWEQLQEYRKSVT